jgi:hypothetical protein
LFSRFEQHTGHDPGFCQVGSLLIASTPAEPDTLPS